MLTFADLQNYTIFIYMRFCKNHFYNKLAEDAVNKNPFICKTPKADL